MKRKITILLNALLISIFANAQYSETGDPSIVNTQSVTVLNDVLYSTSLSMGVWKYESGSWQACGNANLDGFSKQTKHVSAANGFLYAGTPGGTMRSDDGGDSWMKADTGMGTSIIYYGRRHYFVDSVYFGFTTQPGSFYRSQNGTSWLASSAGLPTNVTVYHLLQKGSELFLCTNLGFYKSSDAGFNWSEIPVPESAAVLSGIVLGDRIVIILASYGAFISEDGGANWTSTNGMSGAVGTLSTIVDYNGKLYANMLGTGMFTSTDNGENWVLNNDGIAEGDTSRVTDVTFNSEKLLVSSMGSLYFEGEGSSSGGTGSNSVGGISGVVLTVYPNPSSGGVTFSGFEGEADVEFYTTDGQLLEKTKIYNGQTLTFDYKGVVNYRLQSTSDFIDRGRLILQ